MRPWRLPAETRLMVLAPVVRNRKGEFAELFQDMQSQGFVRFRVDGATVDAAEVPKLKKSEKHDIDVVVDRIKVRRHAASRAARLVNNPHGAAHPPAEVAQANLGSGPADGGAGNLPPEGARRKLGTRRRSAQQRRRCCALARRDGCANLGSGPTVGDNSAKATRRRDADGRGSPNGRRREPREHLFSSKFACPLCDYSLPELEPRLFSFNSPVGACPTCGGLGVTTVFDAERVVAFPTLSLASGAVKGWDRRNAYTFSMLESVARHYGFDIDAPFEELSDTATAACCCTARAATRSSSSTRPKARAASTGR